MGTRATATWKSFLKMLGYQALLIASIEIQKAGSLDLINVKVIGSAVVLAVIKAALTWFTVEA